MTPRLMIIGEAWGTEEEAKRQPFVGPSGYELDTQLQSVGLDRRKIRVTNVVNARPPGNEIDLWFANKTEAKREHVVEVAGRYPRQPIHDGLQALQTEIDAYQPTLIIALGNTPLWALTGLTGIVKWRGSILGASGGPVDGHGVKLIPTLHPAFILREYQFRIAALTDLGRAKHESEFPEIRRPAWNFVIPSSPAEARDWFGEFVWSRPADTPIVADVENVIGPGSLICLGFAVDQLNAICIPFMHRDPGDRAHYWNLDDELDLTLQCIKVLKERPIIFHNGLHDVQIIASQWGTVPYFAHDTMVGQHVLYPGMFGGKIDPVTGKSDKKGSSLSLAFCASLYCSSYKHWKCLQGDVEVLTQEGWVKLDTLPTNVMCSDQEGNLSFQDVQTISYPFNGRGYRIRQREHDCWYTNNHKILHRPVWAPRNITGEIEYIPRQTRFITSGYYLSGMVDVPSALIRLLVAIQADGHITENKNGTFLLQITLKRPRKIERFMKICRELPELQVKISDAGWENRQRMEAYLTGELANWIGTYLGAGKEKRFGGWLLDFTPNALENLLDELPYWDGWFYGKSIYYSTIHKENAEWIALVAHLCRRRANVMHIQQKKWPYYKVAIKSRDYVSISGKHFSLEEFSGDVYCLHTPTGFFLARSNGNIFITGNSDGRSWDAEINTEEDYWNYNMEDTVRTYEVFEEQQRRLTNDSLQNAYLEKMSDFGPVFAMMFRGLNFDREARFRQSLSVARQKREIQAWIDHACNQPLNVDSNPQMCRFFYEDLQVPAVLNRKTRQPTTDSKTGLPTIAKRRPLLRPLVERIEALRSLNTFQENFLSVKLSKNDARLRAAFQVAGTESMRFTSNTNAFGEGINLQNIPRPPKD